MTEHLEAPALLRRAVGRHPGRVAVSTSFQAGGVVLLHLLRGIVPRTPVLFCDTGFHFPETLAFRDRLAADWDLDLWVVRAESPDGAPCCSWERKVAPLYGALEGFSVWVTALRRDQGPTRADVRTVEAHLLPSGHRITKVNPLADWTWSDLWSYVRRHRLPAHPLYEQGYASIGCRTCTEPPPDPARPRSGRFGGRRLECGLHTVSRRLR